MGGGRCTRSRLIDSTTSRVEHTRVTPAAGSGGVWRDFVTTRHKPEAGSRCELLTRTTGARGPDGVVDAGATGKRR